MRVLSATTAPDGPGQQGGAADVRRHHGRRYFDHMKVVIKRGHRTVTQHLVFRKEDGGAEPFWWGPDAGPCL